MRPLWGSLLVLVCACDDGPRPPPFPIGDGGSQPTIALTLELVEPETPIRLAASESVSLRFRLYSTSANEPEAEAVIHCSATGVLGDATLASSATTDELGEATLALSAGSEPAFLKIRCSTLRASDVELHAAISPSGGFAALLVEPAYEGTRSASSVRVSVHYGRDCEPLPTQSAHVTYEGALDAQVRVEPIPIELAPTLVVELLDAGGRPLARGCADSLEPSLDEDLVIAVPVEDLPLQIAGDHPATLQLRSSSAPSVAALAGQTGAFAELGAYGNDVDYMLAMLRMGLVARGFEVDLVTLEQDLSDNYATELAEAYVIDGNTPSDVVDALNAIALGATGALVLEGTLSIGVPNASGIHALSFDVDAIGAGASTSGVTPIALADFAGSANGAGLGGPLLESGLFSGDLSFGLGGGAIVAAGLLASLDPATYDQLLGTFGCSTFAQLASFEVTFLECEEACRLEVCELAFSRVLSAYLVAVSGASAGTSLALELDLQFAGGASVIPESLSVEHALARLMSGGTTFETLETLLDVSL
jgi:hypothetical protein